MNFDNKTILLRFITRPGMCITVQDKDNIISFLSGYEIGSATCDFTELLEVYISDTFKIQSSSSRWIGQVEQLSKKLSLNWMATFRRTALQLIVDSDTADLKAELNKTLRTRILSLTNRIKESGDPWFNESWIDEWLALCLIKGDWFLQMWTSDELKVIKAIDTKVRHKKVFADKDNFFPSIDLLKFKQKLDNLKIQSGT